MEARISLGRIWGIPVGLHASWFLIFALVTLSLAAGYFPEEYPELPAAAYWVLGVVTAALFFGSVLAHELAHAWVAVREQVPVRSITLFLFGGVAQIEREPHTAGAELRIAIAGPIASLLLAAGFGLLYLLDRSVSAYLAAPTIWLARINLLLAVFNMIPGFPLDGGRVLRAVLWHVTRSERRATSIAGNVGQLVALGFVGWGVFTLFSGALFNGIWLIFIGWFLQSAAQSAIAHSRLQDRLRGVTVAQVMSRDCVPVPDSLSVRELVEERMMLQGQRCFYVPRGEGVGGLVTANDVIAIPRDRWSALTVGDVAVAAQEDHVAPTTDLLEALRLMDVRQLQQVPVLDGRQIIGVLSREQVVNFLRVRADLGY